MIFIYLQIVCPKGRSSNGKSGINNISLRCGWLSIRNNFKYYFYNDFLVNLLYILQIIIIHRNRFVSIIKN